MRMAIVYFRSDRGTYTEMRMTCSHWRGEWYLIVGPLARLADVAQETEHLANVQGVVHVHGVKMGNVVLGLGLVPVGLQRVDPSARRHK
jgi:hypothetical protein